MLPVAYPAKNISKNQLPGTANTRIASSVSVSPKMRYGIQDKIMIFDIRKIAFAGALAWKYEDTSFFNKQNEWARRKNTK